MASLVNQENHHNFHYVKLSEEAAKTFLTVLDGRMGGRDGGRAITKAICGTITKDYAWMRFAAFDAFEDDQTEA